MIPDAAFAEHSSILTFRIWEFVVPLAAHPPSAHLELLRTTPSCRRHPSSCCFRPSACQPSLVCAAVRSCVHRILAACQSPAVDIKLEPQHPHFTAWTWSSCGATTLQPPSSVRRPQAGAWPPPTRKASPVVEPALLLLLHNCIAVMFRTWIGCRLPSRRLATLIHGYMGCSSASFPATDYCASLPLPSQFAYSFFSLSFCL